MQRSPSAKRRMRRGCCGCAAAPAGALCVLAIILALNNRPADDVLVPTPPMPVTNAYGVCAGRPGIPLRYHVNDGGRSYVLYSIGPDMRDDGGTPWHGVLDKHGDIIAGYLNAR